MEVLQTILIVIWNINKKYFLESVNTSYNNPASSYNVAGFCRKYSMKRLTLHHKKYNVR